MNELYKNPQLYDIFYDSQNETPLKNYYSQILKNKTITSIFDCSIGTGNLTYVLADMNYHISGSDISEDMIKIANEKAEERNISVDIIQSDFREIDKKISKKFDCVMSTGNSLPHVSQEGLVTTLKAMTKLLNPKGYIYLDIRNWDKILSTKERFNVYNPVIKDDERINVTLVRDFYEECIDFTFIYTFEKNRRIYKKEETKVTYYPLKKDFILSVLESLGYENIEIHNFINQEVKSFDDMSWYSIIGRLKE